VHDCNFQGNSVAGGTSSGGSGSGLGGAIFYYSGVLQSSGNTFGANTQESAGTGADLYCYNGIPDLTNGKVACACLEGFHVVNGGPCVDINECTATPCDLNGICTNTPGSYECACAPGYTGSGEPGTCSDIDECATDTDNCHANAECANTSGGFDCTCKAGYSGNGVSCTDIDECSTDADDCHENAVCTNTEGAYNCACLPGQSCD
jgi:hypothetical protein